MVLLHLDVKPPPAHSSVAKSSTLGVPLAPPPYAIPIIESNDPPACRARKSVAYSGDGSSQTIC